MTGCSADYCTNSSSKGFQMCRFPREEKRRKVLCRLGSWSEFDIVFSDVHNNSEEIQETEGSIEELKEKTPFEETLEQRFNRLQKLYDKSEKSRIALKKSLIAANKRNKKLQLVYM
ncbi:uncharacterized protein LOC112459278 [Temnothorax curvispinosus]|uniref:Uncharacterized protein LOC112459278 n=1 Tax=Temnothorax curvispinosus TaxID=300111 RepID=A0A6J1QEE6_9HYME|nr:uncharacterized protein LOC112459278 [Temnothorax curvispinosus]XP_024879086.1 uncharacterized protein LOC112459278 [Temnothorax curvispinosus]XP_024879087.1 uncharacterized protein LOC112459278 [Temnothorax curvispinosus]